MPIEWNDNLKTGVPIIDEQHQELLVMLNRLGRFKCGRESFIEAFSELEDYVNVHFKTEEDYMCSINYPKYDEHKVRHDEFISGLAKFEKNTSTYMHINDLGDEIIKLVNDWIMNHYANEDVELAEYIRNYKA